MSSSSPTVPGGGRQWFGILALVAAVVAGILGAVVFGRPARFDEAFGFLAATSPTPSPSPKMVAALREHASWPDVAAITWASADKRKRKTPLIRSYDEWLTAQLASGQAELVGASLRIQKHDYIVGGHEFRRLPAIGALMVDDGADDGLDCTATMIGSWTVLTAAHCLVDLPADARLRFVAGPNAFVAPASANFAVDRASSRFPPEYDPGTGEGDLALVSLKRRFTGLHARVPAVVDPRPLTRGVLTFIGYGYVGEGGTGRIGEKRAVQFAIDLPPEDEWFTYTSEPRSAGVCGGDSGGPAVEDTSAASPVILGVNVASDPLCTSHGTSTRIDHFATWIRDNRDERDR